MANFLETPIPITQLISHPLLAITGADFQMSQTTLDFIKELFNNSNTSLNNGDENLGTPKMLNFSYDIVDTVFDASGDLVKQTTNNTFSIPLLSIINLPSLQIQKANVDLVIDVSDIVQTNNTNNTNLYKAFGRLSSSTSNETTTNANYKISVSAERVDNTEALNKVLSALTNISSENPTNIS
jgi:hypothetical protein